MAVRAILITGGAGLIGSAVTRKTIQRTADRVVVVDKLTYTGGLISLAPVVQDARFAFEQVNVCDRGELDRTFRQHQPSTVMHLVAENHVDRSVDGLAAFTRTNILGTYTPLEAARGWWNALATERKSASRFHRISTDEVYGDLHGSEDLFTETTSYALSNPYSASKVSNDHLVRAWLRTYGLSTLITNYFSNYSPYHFPEKLIPLTVPNALAGGPPPMYGNGQRIRDWLYVKSHARALHLVAARGGSGETYNIGGCNEHKNIEIVETICQLLEELAPHEPQNVVHYYDLITFITDRPGYDLHCVIDASEIVRELGRTPAKTLTSGMCKTMAWYLANESQWYQAQDGSYQGKRLRLRG